MSGEYSATTSENAKKITGNPSVFSDVDGVVFHNGKIVASQNKSVVLKPGPLSPAPSTDSQGSVIVDNNFLPQQTLNPTVDASLAIGLFSGNAEVSNLGSAEYTIPIEIPKGAKGTAPPLAIKYNSLGGNGLLGMGWELIGLQDITRVGQSLHFDSNILPVQLSSNDRYSLSGQRLVMVNGAGEGLNGTEYNFEARTTDKIFSRGSVNGGPEYFEIKSSNGSTVEFGKTENARLTGDNSLFSSNTTPLVWKINKIKDIYGNYIRYTYKKSTNPFVDTESYLEKIEYSLNDNASNEAPYVIYFKYSNRNDTEEANITPGTSIKKSVLLKHIEIHSHGRLLKKYSFDYISGNITHVPVGSPRLHKVWQETYDGTKLNPIVINWNLARGVYEVNRVIFPVSNSHDNRNDFGEHDCFGDFNGDGKIDHLHLNDDNSKFRLSNNRTLSFTFPTLSNGIGNTDFGQIEAPGAVVIDHNSDGLDDVMVYWEDEYAGGILSRGLYVIESIVNPTTGDFSYRVVSPFNSAPDRNHYQFHEDLSYRIGDFNGDKNIDLLVLKTSNKTLMIMGTNVSRDPVLELTDGINPKEVFTLDIDGDGKTEIMSVYDDRTTYKLHKLDNTTNEFNSQLLSSSGLSTDCQCAYYYPGDFNGDGKSDLFAYYRRESEKSNGKKNARIFYSDGSKLYYDYENSFILPDDLPSNKINVADFNGDGKADIQYIKQFEDDERKIRLEFWYGKSVGLQHVGAHDVDFVWNFSDYTSRLIDYDSDGSIDVLAYRDNFDPYIISFANNGFEYYVNKISDSYTNSVEFEYNYLSISKQSDLYSRSRLQTDDGKVNYLGKGMKVVSKITLKSPETVEIEYKYRDALFHKNGKNLLGFLEITKNNTTFSKSMVSNYTLNTDYFFIYPTSVNDYYVEGTTLKNISTINYTGKTVNLGKTYLYYTNKIESKLREKDDSPGTFHTQLTNNITFEESGNLLGTLKEETSTSLDGYIKKTTYTNQVYGSYIINEKHIKTEVSYNNNVSKFTTDVEKDYSSSGILNTIYTYHGHPKQITTQIASRDVFGNILEQRMTGKVDNTNNQTRYSSYEYDSDGIYLEKSKNTNGGSESYVSTNYIDKFTGNLLLETGENNSRVFYEYDAWDKLIKKSDPFSSQSYSYDWQTGTYLYKLTTTDNQDATYVATYYDKGGRALKSETNTFISNDPNKTIITAEKEYNALGLLSKELSNSFDGSARMTTTYTYDYENRPSQVSTSRNGKTVTKNYHYNGLTTLVDYPDSYGNTRTSSSTQYMFGQLKQYIPNTAIASEVFNYTYHGSGKVETQVSANKYIKYVYEDGTGFKTEMDDDFDITGSSSGQKLKDYGKYTYSYNSFGELYNEVNPKNQTITYQYDVFGRAYTKTFDSKTIHISYLNSGNGKGQLGETYFNNQSYSQKNSYDQYGRILTVQKKYNCTGGVCEKIFTTNYKYDRDKLSEKTYPNGFAVGYVYTKGILTDIVRKDDGTNTLIWKLNNMNEIGQITSAKFGTQGNIGYTYDEFYNLHTKFSKWGNKTLFDQKYDFDYRLGNLMSRNNISHPNTIESFKYDSRDRLTEITNYNNNTKTINYNTTGKLSYKYDAGTFEYASNSAFKVGRVTSPTSDISHETQNVTYDTQGDVIKIDESPAGSSIFTDIYNGPDESRWKLTETVNNSPTVYVTKVYYDSEYEEEEHTINTRHREINYITAPTGLVAVYIKDSKNNTQKLYHVHTDHLGSICTISDEDEVVTERSFDAWGRVRTASTHAYTTLAALDHNDGIPLLRRGYTGHEHLELHALIHMNGRVYDPVMGRFLSPDPMMQTDDPFSYAGYNPLSRVDPSGYFFTEYFNLLSAIYMPGLFLHNQFTTPCTWAYENRQAILTGVSIVVGVAISVATAGTGTKLSVGLVLAVNAMTASLTTAYSTAISGGSLGQVIGSALIAGAASAATGGVWNGGGSIISKFAATAMIGYGQTAATALVNGADLDNALVAGLTGAAFATAGAGIGYGIGRAVGGRGVKAGEVGGDGAENAVLLDEEIEPGFLPTKGFKIAETKGNANYGKFGMTRINSRTGLPKAHRGLDLLGEVGDPVYAAYDGEVIGIGVDRANYGPNSIRTSSIISGKKYNVDYGHLSKSFVKKGDYVYRGDRIGLIGREGNIKPFSPSTYPTHLHIGIWRTLSNGQSGYVNPVFGLPNYNY
ncbi:MAG: peptidoglycan DD-metalloendopeptidase family protein [Cytophagales bacterium]|nr:peptidoglycan DD-metalloendopeptidase family protein [Cytophagales bacterium]